MRAQLKAEANSNPVDIQKFDSDIWEENAGLQFPLTHPLASQASLTIFQSMPQQSSTFPPPKAPAPSSL
jgi:hypothetical protein